MQTFALYSMRPTIRDIAKIARTHISTVSRALRGDLRISRDVREKIKKIALEIGYEPDPLLSALSAYRKLKGNTFRGTIGWVDNFPTRNGYEKFGGFKRCFESSSQRASEFGYKVESFWLRERGMTAKRASEILRARNVSALILCPQPRARFFSVVAIGHSLTHPRFHRVAGDQYHASLTAMRELRSLGYRQIGFAMSKEDVERTNNNYLAAYLVEQKRLQPRHQIPPFIKSMKTDFTVKAFMPWFRQYQPDAILSMDERILEWLKAVHKKVPRDVGFASLTVSPTDTVSGIDHDNETIGRNAVDFLISMLQRSERGIPKIPSSLLTETKWNPGQTVRRVNV
jgi:DNA-binding LacI/PurR family transcriptional regulator